MDKELVLRVLEMALSGDSTPKCSGYDRYVGENVFIRTVTYHYTGKVIGVDGDLIHLKDAAWIADSGRFNEALKDTGNIKEAEPYHNDVSVSIGAICDITTVDKLVLDVR